MMTRIRGGSGLGDSIYLRPVAEHFRRSGPVTVCSNYPDVFIGTECAVEPFRRERVDVVAHYVNGKENPETTIWQDLCAHAKVEAPLCFSWEVRNKTLAKVLETKAAGRPILMIHGGREPMGRRDRFGIDLLPDRKAFLTVLDALKGCFTVRVGHGNEIYSLPSEADYYGKTSVSDLLDIAAISSGIVSMCGFPVPLAEALDKPLLAVWSSKGLVSATPFIRTVTPNKILSKPTSRFVMDDWPVEQLQEGARAFRVAL